MRQTLQSFETVPIEDLKPHPKNPRCGDLASITASIDANGWYGAVVAQRSTRYILAGNHRWKAAGRCGVRELPVLWVDVDDAHALRILLADNRTSDLAAYDDASLAGLLDGLLKETGSLEGTGYSAAELDALLASLQPPQEAAPAPDQTGQLAPSYQILIECIDEAQQTEWLDRLEREGVECRALIG